MQPRWGRPWNSEGVLAVLHGVVADGAGLFALLEERLSRDAMHHFALATPAAQAARLLEAYLQVYEEAGRAGMALSVHVLTPDPVSPRHCQLVLHGGEALRSTDGTAWTDRRPLSDDGAEWTRMFKESVRL